MNLVDPVTFDEAARILGCARSTVQVMIADGRLTASGPYERGRLSRADVEALALAVYDWRQHVDVRHRDGVRLYRPVSRCSPSPMHERLAGHG